MRNDEQIVEKAFDDWRNYYYKLDGPDWSNSGDVLEWGARQYLRRLLDVYPCNWCNEWFDTEKELCEHLKEHGYKIVEHEWNQGYSDYGKVYYIPKSDSSEQKMIKEER